MSIDDIPIMTYEQVADLFMSTLTGQSVNISRAELMEKLHVRFPDIAQLNIFIQFSAESYAQYVAAGLIKQ